MADGDGRPAEDTGPVRKGDAQPTRSRWAFETRLNRVSRALTAAYLSVEVLFVLFLIVLAGFEEARNPYKESLAAFGIGPGAQIVARPDPVRAAVFFVGTVCVEGVLALGAIALWRSLGPGARPFGPVGRAAVRVSILFSVLGPVLLISASSTVGWGLGGRLLVAAAVLLVVGVLLLPVVDVLFQDGVRPRGREWLAVGTISVLLVVIAVATQKVDTGTYQNEVLFLPSKQLAAPLLDGFWRDSLVQHPTSELAAVSACGDTVHCALWGQGIDHRIHELSGEVTVTADGGRTWHSWLLPQLQDEATPFGLGAACTGPMCIAPIITGGFYVADIRAGGSIAGRLVDAHAELDAVSCPTATWCAGVTDGTVAGPPALVIAEGPELVEHDVALPSGLAPIGTSVVVDSLHCPVPGTCVMVRTIGAGPERLTPTQRSALGIGDVAISVTDDGGATWSSGTFPAGSQVTEASTGSIGCPDQLTCWAIFPTGGAGRQVGLFRSSDTGRSWEPVAFPSGAAGAGDPRITCGNASSCFLIGQQETTGTSIGFRTLDSGLAWGPVTLPVHRVCSGSSRPATPPGPASPEASSHRPAPPLRSPHRWPS